jgi:hypothetical protein
MKIIDMPTNTSREFDRAQRTKEEASKRLLSPDSPNNVVGVGVGENSDGYRLRIYVLEELDRVASKLGLSKRALGEIDLAKLVRDAFPGIPIDVIPTQRFGRHGNKPKAMADINQPEPRSPQPGSPIRVQTVAPNVNSGAIGTLGAVVELDGSTQRYILGCNHILAANGRVRQDPNAEILWAQRVGEQKTIADRVFHFPLNRNTGAGNDVDCALATIRNQKDVRAIFPAEIGALTSNAPIHPTRGMPVVKVGSSTGRTQGTIVDIDADLYVDYSFGTFRFNNQIIIEGENGNFATAGDSGSILVHIDEKEKKTQAVGMIFAASGQFAVACRLETVLEKLKTVLDEVQKGMRHDPKANLDNVKDGNNRLKLATS